MILSRGDEVVGKRWLILDKLCIVFGKLDSVSVYFYIVSFLSETFY